MEDPLEDDGVLDRLGGELDIFVGTLNQMGMIYLYLSYYGFCYSFFNIIV